MSSAYVLLEDGTRLDGDAVGAPGPALGEVVFNTAMTGYQEAVTDPPTPARSSPSPIPLIGNYGVWAHCVESDRAHARAVIMREAVEGRAAGFRRILARLARAPGRFRGRAASTRAGSCATSATAARCGAASSPARWPSRGGARADRGRAARCSAATWPAMSPRRSRSWSARVAPVRAWPRSTPASRRSIVRNLTSAACTLELLPCTTTADEVLRARAGRRVPRQRPGRPGRARLRRGNGARAGREGAGVRHLPRPPAAVPGGRPRDLQAALRPPRRQPSGQGPRDREDRDHGPEPRLRGASGPAASTRSPATSRCAGRPTSAPPSCRT